MPYCARTASVEFCRLIGILALAALVCGTSPAATYPLKVSSSNPHLLVDQNEVPFLIHGDCAWALTVRRCRTYPEDRRQKGFNTVVVMLIANHVFINRHRTANH